MEIALQQQSQELSRSRSDYSALFQNFKQSRIIFEERELASNAQMQRIQNENKELEGALKQLTGELRLCRSEFTELMKSYEQSTIAAERRDQTYRVQLQQVTDHYEASKRKSRELKRALKEQRAMQEGLRIDFEKIEQSTKIFELREQTVAEKYENIASLNCDLTEEVQQKSEHLLKLSADLERLSSVIANEMVSKTDFDRILFENQELKRKLLEETICLETHSKLKERYADLQLRIDGSMVTAEEHDAVVSQLEALKKIIEQDIIAPAAHAELQENFQKVVDEKYAIIETVKILQDAKISILRALSEAEDRSSVLQIRLDEVETELTACKTREDLRSEISAIEDDRRQNLDRNLLTQRNIQSINSIRKDRETSEKYEESLRAMESEFAKSNQVALEELERQGLAHCAELEEQRNLLRSAVEEERALGATILRELKAQHTEELTDIHERHKHQLSSLRAEEEEGRKAADALFKSKISIADNAHQIAQSTLLKKHISDIEGIKAAVISDSHRNMIIALGEQKNTFIEEFSALRQELTAARADLAAEKARADTCTSELIRIEKEYQVALKSVEQAYSKEVVQRETVNAENYKWQQHAESTVKKMTGQEELLKSMTEAQKRAEEENQRLREVALSYEADSKSLRSQLEDVKDAVLESMSATLARTADPRTSSYSTSINMIRSSDSADREVPLPKEHNANGKALVKPTRNTVKNVRSKGSEDDLRGSHSGSLTAIHAAISRKHVATVNYLSTVPYRQNRQREREHLKDPLPVQKAVKGKKKLAEEYPGSTTQSQTHMVPTSSSPWLAGASQVIHPPRLGEGDRMREREGERDESERRVRIADSTFTAPSGSEGGAAPSSSSSNRVIGDRGRDRDRDLSPSRERVGTGFYALYSPITPASTGRPALLPAPAPAPPPLALTLTADPPVHPPISPVTPQLHHKPLEYSSLIPGAAHSSSLELMDRLIHSAKIRSPLGAGTTATNRT
jgi:hypothetical protein